MRLILEVKAPPSHDAGEEGAVREQQHDGFVLLDMYNMYSFIAIVLSASRTPLL